MKKFAAVFLLLMTTQVGVWAQDNPDPLFEELPLLAILPEDAPEFGNVTYDEFPKNLEETVAPFAEGDYADTDLHGELMAFYESVGVQGSHISQLLADECNETNLFGVESWLRLLPDAESARLFVDHPTGQKITERYFGWMPYENPTTLPGNLYTSAAEEQLCSQDVIRYTLEYPRGPIAVALTIYAPTDLSPDTVISQIRFYSGLIDERIAAATGINLEVSSVGGLWTGTLYQPTDGIQTQYPFEMTIAQDGSAIRGTTRIEGETPSVFGVIRFTGTYENGVITFTESEVESQGSVDGFFWCIKTGVLFVENDLAHGPWQAADCSGGTILVERAN